MIGGAGMMAGVSTIVLCVLTGYLFKKISFGRTSASKILGLYVLGLTSHIVMLLCQLLLPWPYGIEVIRQIGPSVMMVFPVSFVAMALLVQGIDSYISGSKKIAQAEILYRTTLQSIGDAVIGADKNGLINQMNPAAEVFTGWRLANALGKALGMIVSIEGFNSKTISDWIALTINSKEPVKLADHLPLLAKSGAVRMVDVSGSPVKDDNNTTTGAVFVFGDRTEEYRMQSELKESEARWQFALEGAGDGVWDWDVTSGRVYYSDQWKTMLGYLPDEINNDFQEWKVRVHPDDLSRALQDIDDHVKGDTPVYINEHRLRCKDGSYKWILDRGKIVKRDPHGNPTRIIGIHSDITQRKEAELKYEATQFGIDHAKIGVYQVEEDGTISYINEYAAKSLGYKQSELIGTSLFAITPAFQIDDFIEHREKARMKGSNTIISRHRRKNGTDFPVEVTTNYFLFREKLMSFSFVKDISERVKAEQALTDSESRFRLLAESAPIGIVISDKFGNTLYVNEYFTQLFAYTLNDIPTIDHWWESAYPNPDHRNDVQKIWRDFYDKTQSGEIFASSFEYMVTGKMGQIFYIEFRLSSTDELDFIFFTDITAKKQTEKKLTILNEELEEKIKEKTLQLQERVEELERFHEATIDREYRIKELRDEINRLKK
jgi:PAS domain S-box-containing protein